MRILQVAPEIGPGTGVGGVAHQLETEWRRHGIPTARFTLAEARGGWLPKPGPGLRGKLALLARVAWFSTVGSVLARGVRRAHPDTIVVCHNDALVGDVYVNHGVVLESMRRRGHAGWRVLRNPVHPFTIARDALRYRSIRVHRVIVSLTTADADALRRTYGRLGPPSVVIGNGVDPDRFTPATEAERQAARARLSIGPDDAVVLFVGHEFDRKGLPQLTDAIAGLPERVHLLVVGGTPDLVEAHARRPAAKALGSRLHLVGAVADPTWAFHAADVFVLASSYEAHSLVVLEALSCGLPVVATAVGSVPELIETGRNGWIVEPSPESIRAAVAELLTRDQAGLREAARDTALANSWGRVAERYLKLFGELTGPGAYQG